MESRAKKSRRKEEGRGKHSRGSRGEQVGTFFRSFHSETTTNDGGGGGGRESRMPRAPFCAASARGVTGKRREKRMKGRGERCEGRNEEGKMSSTTECHMTRHNFV